MIAINSKNIKDPKYICGAFFMFFFVFLLSGCENREISIKVSLKRRSAASISPPTIKEEGTLKFGFDLRLNPREDVMIYTPFISYLEKETGKRFSIRFTEKYEDTMENLGKGVTHFAAMGPVNCVLASKKYGAGCLVMGLNSENKPEYRAVIFTRPNSSIKSLTELKGKTFAFGDKYSTQGHIIPRKMLEDVGIDLKDLKGYVFTGSHVNTARAVLKGDYDAGAIQDTLAKNLLAEGKIKVIAISKPYPSSLICYNKDLDPSIVQSVKKALLSFDPQGKHKNIVVNWNKTEMPNGFAPYNENSMKEIKALTIKYGLIK